jgi:hypothetical protein
MDRNDDRAALIAALIAERWGPTSRTAAPTNGQVWIATMRRGITAHALGAAGRTRCGRSTRTGLTLPGQQAADQHQVTWCRHCWPTTP